jgi:predicted metal-dependent phosphoesterase TrpH
VEPAEERLGRCDPHIHTTYSDGLGTPRQVVEAAVALGLDVIAITDHDSVQGALEARDFVAREGYPIDVIVGTEVTTARGVHVLALFVEERLPMLRPAARTIEEIARRGGVALAPHPLSALAPSMGRRMIENVLALGLPLAGVETFNPSPAGRPRARLLALNRRWGLAEFGGSDAHFPAHIAAAYTLFPGRSADDFRRALLERTTVARLAERPPARVPLSDYARQTGRALFLNPAQKMLRKVRAARR